MAKYTNSYIKLNSKDATLFVYKKTIFDINQEYRNNMTLTKTDKSYVSKMRKFTECYNMLFLNLIELQMDELVKANDKHKEYMKYNKDFDRLISISYNIFIKKNYDTFTKIINYLSEIDDVEFDSNKLTKALKQTQFKELQRLEKTEGFEEKGKGEFFFRKGKVGTWKDEVSTK